jgi:hypothetical protein
MDKSQIRTKKYDAKWCIVDMGASSSSIPSNGARKIA